MPSSDPPAAHRLPRPIRTNRRRPIRARRPRPRPSGQDPGEWEIQRVPLRYDRAVLAAAVVRGKLRTTIARRVRAYGGAAHQQAAMPEQVLALPVAAPERGDQEPEVERRGTVDLSAPRALKKSRTDVEALGFTDEQLRRLLEVSTRAGDQSRERAARHADRQDDDAPQLLRENDCHQAHRPRQPGPHRGPEVGR
ncbi:hypothetical protein [Streptomyces sp. NPDC058155]|uniref:hypothetical protein n=1 Tax=Streptomyces sp. NPDC058155 TaxID=3346359 RepID=UPI0036ED5A2B